MRANITRTGNSQGFSLVELMVGIVVALLAIIVVMQVFRTAEGSRRTTTGGDDAQTTGIIALSVLQRDIQQAGQGMNSEYVRGCSFALRAGVTVANFSGVSINHPGVAVGDSNTDTLLVAYGSSNGSPEGARISTQPSSAIYALASSTTFAPNDWVYVARVPRPATCDIALTRVTIQPAFSQVTVAAGTPNASNSALFNLGQTPVVMAYAVRNGQLTQCNYQTNDCRQASAGNWAPIGEGVVSFRAVYAKDTNKDEVVDTFDQATPTTMCGWYQVSAIRIGMLVRSGQLEKEDVTLAAPPWSAAASTPFVPPGSEWKRFRYKSFETTIPLRNFGWLGAPSPC